MAEPATEILYVSWGGAGRGTALRRAHARAAEANRGLVYLAILDRPTFSDLDPGLLSMVEEELTWLLEAQLRLVHAEHLDNDAPTRFVIRGGDVLAEVTQVAKAMGSETIFIGAPVVLAQHDSIDDLVSAISEQTGATVEVIGPAHLDSSTPDAAVAHKPD